MRWGLDELGGPLVGPYVEARVALHPKALRLRKAVDGLLAWALGREASCRAFHGVSEGLCRTSRCSFVPFRKVWEYPPSSWTPKHLSSRKIKQLDLSSAVLVRVLTIGCFLCSLYCRGLEEDPCARMSMGIDEEY